MIDSLRTVLEHLRGHAADTHEAAVEAAKTDDTADVDGRWIQLAHFCNAALDGEAWAEERIVRALLAVDMTPPAPDAG